MNHIRMENERVDLVKDKARIRNCTKVDWDIIRSERLTSFMHWRQRSMVLELTLHQKDKSL